MMGLSESLFPCRGDEGLGPSQIVDTRSAPCVERSLDIKQQLKVFTALCAKERAHRQRSWYGSGSQPGDSTIAGTQP